jgi:RNA polymerase sigma factor (sigma-70 family)
LLEAHLGALLLYPGGVGALPDVLWDAFAVFEDGPPEDRRVFALKAALEQLAEHWPVVAARDDLHAFQIVGTDQKKDGRVQYQLRVNESVRGVLTLRCCPSAETPGRFIPELQFEPATDEVANAAHYLVLMRREAGRVRGIRFIDEVGLIASQASAREIRDQIDRSLPAGGPRERWRGLMAKGALGDEIPSVYFEVGGEAPDSLKLALRALERLEASVRAGMPSRRSGFRLEPLPEDLAASPEPGGPDDPTVAEARIDLQRVLDKLADPHQEVIRLLYVEGLTEAAIAKRLGVSQQAVSKRLKKAVSELRKSLSG